MQQGLVGSRAVVKLRYAVLPPEGIPASVLPEWKSTEGRILTAPAMGAQFAMYLLDLGAGGGTEQALPSGIESFLYLLQGRLDLDLNGGGHRLEPGGFAFMRPGSNFAAWAGDRAARLLWLKKIYEPFEGSSPRDLVENEARVRGDTYMGIEGLIL